MSSSPRRAIMLQHVPQEGPARVARAFERAGFSTHVRRLDRGDAVPTALDDFEALIVMGGPMGVADIGDPRFPFLEQEIALLRLARERDFPTLGICLGSQLLAHAAGARVYPNQAGDPPHLAREVGWGAVHFVSSPERESVLSGLDPAEMMLHWHGDTFDLPPGATLLASTLLCRHQMYRLGRRQFGIQFHPEVEAADVEAWLGADGAYVQSVLGAKGPERVRSDTELHLARFSERGDRLLSNIVQAMGY